jgi:hypothetical protein
MSQRPVSSQPPLANRPVSARPPLANQPVSAQPPLASQHVSVQPMNMQGSRLSPDPLVQSRQPAAQQPASQARQPAPQQPAAQQPASQARQPAQQSQQSQQPAAQQPAAQARPQSAMPVRPDADRVIPSKTVDLPLDSTLIYAMQLAIKKDKPIILTFWMDSLENKIVFLHNKSEKETIVYKSPEEYTSPLVQKYTNKTDVICETENSLYIMRNGMATREE